MQNIFTRLQIAENLGVSERTVDRQRASGKLRSRKIGTRVLVTEGDYIAFLEACAVPPDIISAARKKLAKVKAAKGVAS